MDHELTAPGKNLVTRRTVRERALEREISALGFGAITLNGLIGGGIFALPAVAAASAGALSPWLFLICGALFISVVLAFSRAASFSDETGGPITYATRAFGTFAGFHAGWLLYLGRIASMAANTNLMVTYIGWFWAPLMEGPMRAVAIVLICFGLTVVNVIGVRRGMGTVYVLTLLKLIPLSAIVLFGLGHVSAEALFGASLPELGTLGETLLVLMYAFIGFEGAVVPAGEGKDPRRDIPKALILTLLGTTAFYFLIQMASVAVAPGIGDSRTPLADVAMVLFGTAGAGLLSLGAAFSVGGNLSAMMLSAPRMTYALARDGSLPDWFGRINLRYRTPANSIIFLGAVGLVLALTGTFAWLAAMATLARMLVYILSILSIPRLETLHGRNAGSFKLPGGYLIPGIALVICVWLASHASARSWLLAGAFFVVGSILYFMARRSYSD